MLPVISHWWNYARPISVKNSVSQEQYFWIAHRLDRPVSGVVVLARTSKALERMNTLFRNKQTKKVYWAIVKNKPRSDQETLRHWLLKDEAKNRTTAFKNDTEGAQYAELDYRVISTGGGALAFGG